MAGTDDQAATPTEAATTTTTTTTKSTAKATKAAPPVARELTKTELAAADKALATYWETGHVPAGWVYSQGAMTKRTEG